MYDISVCMPYFERKDALLSTLESFKSCGYFSAASPVKIEVSICDDGSKEEPLEESPLYTLTTLPKKDLWLTPCVPINAAVRASNGPVIVLQSPETYHPEPVLYQMADMLEHYKDTVLVACMNTAHGKKNRWYAHPDYKPNKYWWCQTLTRRFFEEIGGFDEAYRMYRCGEDNDFAIRLSDAGARWKWLEGVHVVHGWNMRAVHKTKVSPYPKLIETHGQQSADKLFTHPPRKELPRERGR